MKLEHKIIERFTGAAATFDRDFGPDSLRWSRSVSGLVNPGLRSRGKSNAAILDLGCGTGLSSLEYFRRGHAVTGIDVTPAMLRIARARPFRRLICQNIEAPLKVPARHFDAVSLIGVMEAIRDPLRLFRRIRGVLVDGGLFGFTAPRKVSQSPDNPGYRGSDPISRKGITAMLEEAGLRVVKMRATLGWRGGGTSMMYWVILAERPAPDERARGSRLRLTARATSSHRPAARTPARRPAARTR